jgi:hypothetical protein
MLGIDGRAAAPRQEHIWAKTGSHRHANGFSFSIAWKLAYLVGKTETLGDINDNASAAVCRAPKREDQRRQRMRIAARLLSNLELA